MKILLRFFCVCLIQSIFFSCASDEVDQPLGPTTLLTLNTNQFSGTSATEDYVIIHDENGELLEYKAFEKGQSLTIQTDKKVPGSTITLSFLTYQVEEENKYYYGNTYFGVPKGEMIYLNVISPPDLAIAGQFTITGMNFSGMDQFFISNRFGNGCSGASGQDPQFTCGLRSGASNILFHFSNVSGDIKYKMFQNVQPGDAITTSLSEFNDFDQTVTFKFPLSSSVSTYVTGREVSQTYSDHGYLMNYHYAGDSHSTIKIGYLNSLEKYVTNLRIGFGGYSLSYFNRGSIPDANINWPEEADYSISSNKFTSFTAVASRDFDVRTSHYSYQSALETPYSRIQWNVHSPVATQIFGALPEEIIADHPELVVDNLQHSQSGFFMDSGGYEGYLDEFLRSESPANVPAAVRIGIYIP